jgi:glycosyltransferase involved in cell wall biosynthesis
MRVAYVCADPGLPVFGRKGGSVHVQEVVRALRRQGHQVDLFATRQGGPAPIGLGDVAVHRLPEIGSGAPAEREARGRSANAGLACALDRAGAFDLVYERYSLWSRAGMECAERRGVPGIVEVNAPLIDEQASHRALVGHSEAEQTVRAVFAAATAVVAVSEPVAAWARGRTVDPTKVHVVANGVDSQRITPAPPRPPTATFTVGFLGTLKPWHGLEVLVDAVVLLVDADPSYRLLVVGDGPGADALAEHVEAVGITAATTMTGSVDPEDVPGYLHRMDVANAHYPALAGFYFSPLKLYE